MARRRRRASGTTVPGRAEERRAPAAQQGAVGGREEGGSSPPASRRNWRAATRRATRAAAPGRRRPWRRRPSPGRRSASCRRRDRARSARVGAADSSQRRARSAGGPDQGVGRPVRLGGPDPPAVHRGCSYTQSTSRESAWCARSRWMWPRGADPVRDTARMTVREGPSRPFSQDMALAGRLAHLVRGTVRSGVGRRELRASDRIGCGATRRTRLIGRLLPRHAQRAASCSAWVAPPAHSGGPPPPHRRRARHGHGGRGPHGATGQPSADPGQRRIDQLGATAPTCSSRPPPRPPTAGSRRRGRPAAAGRPRELRLRARTGRCRSHPRFSLTGLSTLAYFSIGVNPDGTLDESGPGWAGFESQDLADLISRAHAAGERVVLTVNDFGQSSLNALTSSPTAAGTLSSTLIPLLEGQVARRRELRLRGRRQRRPGRADQPHRRRLGRLRAADPHWQITMDTYASSAGDTGGFYNIPALAPYVDAFFVMDYELNLAGSPSAASPLTSGAVQQPDHAQAVHGRRAGVEGHPRAAVLRHRLADQQRDHGGQRGGGATDIADSQAQGNGPEYWDPVTGTAWTSYWSAASGTSRTTRASTGSTRRPRWRRTTAPRRRASGPSAWRTTAPQMIAAMDGISTRASPAAPDRPPPRPARPPARAGRGAPAAGTRPARRRRHRHRRRAPRRRPRRRTADLAAPPRRRPPRRAPTHHGRVQRVRPCTLTPVAASQVSHAHRRRARSPTSRRTSRPTPASNGATLNVYDDLLSGKPWRWRKTPTNCIAQDFLLPS